MTAYTVTTLGASGLPPVSGRPTDAERRPALVYAATRRRDPPGPPTDNLWVMADQYVGAVYVAVRKVMEGLAGSSVKILKKRAGGAAALTGPDAKRDRDWEPVADHPASRLFEHVNPHDTLISFLSQYVLCRELFGRTVVWAVPGAGGKPVELWCVRPQYVVPAFGPTPRYPFGAWRLTVPQPGVYGFAQAGTVVIDAREVVDDRLPHPRWDWDGYSPLTGGGPLLDGLRSLNEARKNAVEQGTSLDAIVAVAGASQAELERLKAQYMASNIGPNGERVKFTSGDDIKATALGIAPKEMGFDSGYEQLTNFVLSLFGVPHPVAGLTDTSSYAQLYASLLQFRNLKLQPLADEIAATWTKRLIRPHWGADYRLVVELPQLVDQDELKQRRAALFGAGGVTVNEERAALEMPPVDGGDVPPAVYTQVQQQKAQPQPGAMPGGLPGLGGGTDGQPDDQGAGGGPIGGDAGDEAQADNPLTSGVLEALGVQGGDEPGVVRKAWTQFNTASGGVGARNEQGREIYGEEAKRALAAQQGGGAGQPGQASGQPGQSVPKPGTHRVSYTVGGKPQVADVPAGSLEEAHQIVTALGGKVDAPAPPTGGGKAAGGKKTKPAPNVGRYADRTLGQMRAETKPVDRLDVDELESEHERLTGIRADRDLDPDEAERYAAVGERVKGSRAAAMAEFNRPTGSGTATPQTPTAPPAADTPAPDVHPTAKTAAAKAIRMAKPVGQKLQSWAGSDEGQQSLSTLHQWARHAADKHADAVAAAHDLDTAVAHDLFLHVLEAVVRSIPGIGKGASVALGIVRRHRLSQANQKVQAATKAAGEAVKGAEKANRLHERGKSVPKPPNPAGRGSLGPRVGRKALAAAAVRYAVRLNKSLKHGG